MILPEYDFDRHTIQDPIHGAITFGSIERAVINHPLFQRLHGLRQNSLLHLVFPAANHTRFDHSLGVMWLADKFLERILINQGHICDGVNNRSSFQEPYRVDDDTIRDTIKILYCDKYFKLILRVAALFHDIGHGPLSHLFDKFFPTWEEMLTFTAESEMEHIHTRVSKIPESDKENPIRHEILSCFIATRVLRDCSIVLGNYGLDLDNMTKDVCATIDDQIQGSDRINGPHFKFQYLLHDILSSDLDVDRMDYLLRDSHMCGVNYGLYDPHRILKSMCIYGRTDTGDLRIAVRHSGLGALEDLLLSRYQMHSHIYGHKTNRACSAMLEAIRKRLQASQWKWYRDCKSASDFLDIFLEFNDYKFISELRNLEIDKGQGKVKEIAEKLFIERKLFKRAWEQRFRVKPNQGLQNNETERQWRGNQEILKENEIPFAEDFFVNEGPKFNSTPNPVIKVLKKDPKSRFYMVLEIRDLSSVAQLLPTKEFTYRIYCKSTYLTKARDLMSA